MCDFRIPFFKLNGEPVPCGGGIDAFKPIGQQTFKAGYFYGWMLTGSWSEYYDGQRFWTADEDCPYVEWKHINHFGEE